MSAAHLQLIEKHSEALIETAPKAPKTRAKKLVGDSSASLPSRAKSAEHPKAPKTREVSKTKKPPKSAKSSAAAKTRAKPSKAAKAAATKPSPTASVKKEALAGELMSAPAIACHVGQSLNEAVQLMWEHDLGAIIVVDEHGAPVSMITDRDACMAAYTQGVALYHASIASAMATKLVTCALGTPLSEIQRLMASAKVRRIPVVDETGKLAGIIGFSDLLRGTRASPSKTQRTTSPSATMTQLLDTVLQ
jgi:CBS domain-containing protein